MLLIGWLLGVPVILQRMQFPNGGGETLSHRGECDLPGEAGCTTRPAFFMQSLLLGLACPLQAKRKRLFPTGSHQSPLSLILAEQSSRARRYIQGASVQGLVSHFLIGRPHHW